MFFGDVFLKNEKCENVEFFINQKCRQKKLAWKLKLQKTTLLNNGPLINLLSCFTDS